RRRHPGREPDAVRHCVDLTGAAAGGDPCADHRPLAARPVIGLCRGDARRLRRADRGGARMSNDAHMRPPGDDEEPLYDPAVPTPTHGERARTLAASIATGTLCTIAREPAGTPYGSLVTFAMAGASPVFFISELAEHTKNLRADHRASLMVA